MDFMHPDPEQHEGMDQMMGGEGSFSLKAMHRAMGYPKFLNNRGGSFMGHMWNFRPGMMGYYGWGGIFMGCLFLILIGVVIYLLVKAVSGGGAKPSSETPLDILEKRYARGEITREEFTKMKKDLER